MVVIGEESGRLDNILGTVSEYYENELDNKIKCALYYALALAHLREENYLLSYKAIEQSIRIENNEMGRSIMDVVKKKIVEDTSVR